MEEKLQKLPDYTPNYVKEQFKVYLEEKDNSQYEFFLFQDVLGMINLAKAKRRITKEQAKELKKIISKLK